MHYFVKREMANGEREVYFTTIDLMVFHFSKKGPFLFPTLGNFYKKNVNCCIFQPARWCASHTLVEKRIGFYEEFIDFHTFHHLLIKGGL